MGKKKSAKSSTVVLKTAKPRESTSKKQEIPVDIERVRERMKTNASPKVKQQEGLTNAELRELAKTNKPPQSWYDEDHTGLY